MTHCRHGLRRTSAWHPRLSLTTKDVDDLDMRGLDFGRVQLAAFELNAIFEVSRTLFHNNALAGSRPNLGRSTDVAPITATRLANNRRRFHHLLTNEVEGAPTCPHSRAATF